MLGALFGKKQTETAQGVVYYEPKDETLSRIKASVLKLIAELKKTNDAEATTRAERLSSCLYTFMENTRKWENTMSSAVTKNYLVSNLLYSDKSASGLKSVDVFRLQYVAVNRMSYYTDTLLAALKRGADSSGKKKVSINSEWSGEEGLPTDTATKASEGLTLNESTLLVFNSAVETIKQLYPTVVGVRTAIVLDDIKYSGGYSKQYQSLDKTTREPVMVTQQYYSSVLATPSYTLSVKFLDEEPITFELTSASRMALTAFSGRLNDIAGSYDRLIFQVDETLRSLGTTDSRVEGVWTSLDKVVQAKQKETATRQAAYSNSETSESVNTSITSESDNEGITTSEEQSTNAGSVETSSQTSGEAPNENESTNDNLTTDGRDVQVVDAQTSNEGN